MLGPLDKSFMGGVWWHCNYSFKLQGSRGDLESLSLVELDSRPRENNSWTPSLTTMHNTNSVNENQLRKRDLSQVCLHKDDICIVHVLSAA